MILLFSLSKVNKKICKLMLKRPISSTQKKRAPTMHSFAVMRLKMQLMHKAYLQNLKKRKSLIQLRIKILNLSALDCSKKFLFL